MTKSILTYISKLYIFPYGSNQVPHAQNQNDHLFSKNLEGIIKYEKYGMVVRIG